MTKKPEASTDKRRMPQETRDFNVGGMAGRFLAFRIGNRQLAFPLEKVERVIRMVALKADEVDTGAVIEFGKGDAEWRGKP